MTDCMLCQNMSCKQFPPDWNHEKDTEETYEEDQWRKCVLCPGYFNDDGLGDILFDQEDVACQLCGKDKNIVRMKSTGEYLCGNGCDESDESDESDEEYN